MSKGKERIRDSQLRYKQGLGQNFIYDEHLLKTLVDLSGVTAEDDVLEIGPGSGSMTKYLCQAAHHVLSVELDDRLIPLLQGFLAEYDNFTLVHGDAMTVNLPEITADLRKPLSVVANIPYYITTPLINLFFAAGIPMNRMSLMVQKEVADKILAEPGDDAWCMLSARCQYYADPYLAIDVPAECFTPVPKVDSAFVVLPMRDEPAVQVKDEELFFRVAGAAFALRRKTMTNNLCATFHMERAQAVSLMQSAGLNERVRGEKLTLEELARIADAYYDMKEAAQ